LEKKDAVLAKLKQVFTSMIGNLNIIDFVDSYSRSILLYNFKLLSDQFQGKFATVICTSIELSWLTKQHNYFQ